MEPAPDLSNRRPLKSRSTGWAKSATGVLLRTGISANQVSLLGILIAALGAWAAIKGGENPSFFLLAAFCIQLRLLANMLDGLVAVEGQRGSPTGAIWNEFPDRIEDSLLLVAFGFASIPALGWAAALLAAICAYVRLLGGSLGFAQDFGGPMAKPHRMAALTLTALAGFSQTFVGDHPTWVPLGLAIIVAGTAVTIALRLRRLAHILKGAP